MAIIALVFIIQLAIMLWQFKINTPGSDHFYHLRVINIIKDNNNRFVRHLVGIEGQKYNDFPQLMHWLVAFFPEKWYRDHFRYFSLIISMIQLAVVMLFFDKIYPHLPSIWIERDLFIAISGILYVLTPFSYAIWNAKNVGISARGFGVLMITLYLFSVALYLLENQVGYLVLSYVLALLVIMSSIMATQFLLFFSIIASILFLDPLFALTPFIGAGLFYLILGDIALDYMKSQYWHKRIYYHIQTRTNALLSRYSVWRDPIYDIWLWLIKDPAKGIVYGLYSPVTSVVLLMPAISGAILLFMYHNSTSTIHLPQELILFIKLIGSGLICFVLTSFRKTRFVGEPERYVEFVALFAIPLFILFSRGYTPIYVLMVLSVVLCISQLYLNQLIRFISPSKSTDSNDWIELMNDSDQILEKIDHASIEGNNLIFSNNIGVVTYLMKTRYSVLFPCINHPYTGKFHIDEIFPVKYGNINPAIIEPMTTYFNVSWFILDTTINSHTEVINSSFKLVERQNNLILYRVISNQ